MTSHDTLPTRRDARDAADAERPRRRRPPPDRLRRARRTARGAPHHRGSGHRALRGVDRLVDGRRRRERAERPRGDARAAGDQEGRRSGAPGRGTRAVGAAGAVDRVRHHADPPASARTTRVRSGEGTDREQVLNTIGLGHYQDTAMPGAEGNFAVAGHRVTYGKPLNQIAEMQDGDSIVVRVTDAEKEFDVWYVYKVTDSQIVTPDKIETIAPVPNKPGVEPGAEDRWLTLTACHPMWSAAERYIVHAKMDYWMQASDGTPKELSETAK
ncbi:sortase [Curtobacterium sp. MCJR17_043]|uniref:sortase n=1 Tax=Curtobacterium sp. MCJR17_043 TaxID=2175660 RepID=UPI0024DF9558|nr:sortase [Curtobacterium sp. MCJR17_043]WIB36581.1 sortase [Curtobacterium sp. MCJR17_043]